MASTCKEAVPVPEQFPAGLKVLVVDDDIPCLRILEQMLRKCMYTVTTCSQSTVALNILRERKGFFDLVLSDVHMPDMDGFKLLELVGLEMDLPVIMMSGDDRTSLVMRGIRHGACDYLIKPIRTEELKNIWQHVVRKRCNVGKEHEHSGSLEDNDRLKNGIDDSEYTSTVNEVADGTLKTLKKRKDTKEEDDAEIENDDPSTSKKPRVVWSVELHQQFVSAVNHLGIDKAVPKRILELMNVPGLTRENVASHLQKFRLYLKRISGVAQQQGGLPSSFCGPLEPIPKVGSLGRFDIQALAASGQIPPQTLAALHAELLNRPTGNLVLPAMDQPALLPVSKCITLEQNVAYGQPLMKCPSNISKHFSQTATSADNAHSVLGTWSSQNLVNVVACDNITGTGAQNGDAMMCIMRHQQQQQRQQQQQLQQQKQSTLPESTRLINVQPSCRVAPSHSSANFQAGNSLASINQNCSLSGSSIIDYSILSPQSNISPLGSERIPDMEIKSTGMLSGLSGAGSISPTFSSGSVNADNGVGMQVQNSTSRFSPARQLPSHVPNISIFQDSYNATSGHILDHGMLKSTDLVGRGSSIPSRFAVDETGLLISNVNQEKMYGENNGNKVKLEPNMNFVENAKVGVPMLQRLSPTDVMSVFSD